MSKSELISKGGQGCVFKPDIPCKNSKRQGKKSLSKISFNPESAKREYEMNEEVRKIDNYDDWCILWDNLCKTAKYDKLKHQSDIEKCIYLENEKRRKRNKTQLTPKSNFTMLVGPSGGKSCVEYFEKIFSKDVLITNYKFKDVLLNVMKSCAPLFLGIQQLEAHKISHHDLNNRNILIKNSKIKLIDFGLALKYTEKKKLMKRLKSTFLNDKIYESYPWDYTLLYPSLDEKYKKNLRDELKDLQKNIYRNNYEELENVYLLLGIHDYQEQIMALINDILNDNFNVDPQICLKKLDVYSLGIMIPTIIYRQMAKHNISIKDILKVINSDEVKPYFDLFRDMTYIRCTSRISANLAYDRYKNLL